MVREYTCLEAEATIKDCEAIKRFPFLKGGRTGGVETPFCAVELLEDGLGAELLSWEQAEVGYRIVNDADFMNEIGFEGLAGCPQFGGLTMRSVLLTVGLRRSGRLRG